ncbi:DUF4375 domain-containing protein [Pelomonas sp. SE-A7]|uniref:DMP19 family protein n=1 Tax=Pelomonas sp. SE-A7 TaxID=3054953 RepID=UPI00259C9155|nr:DUF4375 domain-containing protein [Pelomonas sp. SE-A7]MDM4767180.1 DUF4375 domain-containing protein [Pelomonas sp. SE-A7]
MKPGEAYWAILYPIWDEVSIYDGAERFSEDFEKLDRVAQALFAAHWCQSEVCNGGFGQFFGNSTGVLALEAVAGFEALGMQNVASVVRQAVSLFGSAYPSDRAAREEQLEMLRHESLNELDGEFFSFIQSEQGGFVAAADTFAKAHGA